MKKERTPLVSILSCWDMEPSWVRPRAPAFAGAMMHCAAWWCPMIDVSSPILPIVRIEGRRSRSMLRSKAAAKSAIMVVICVSATWCCKRSIMRTRSLGWKAEDSSNSSNGESDVEWCLSISWRSSFSKKARSCLVSSSCAANLAREVIHCCLCSVLVLLKRCLYFLFWDCAAESLFCKVQFFSSKVSRWEVVIWSVD